MLDENPRLFYLHFRARGNATQLAQRLAAALDHVNLERTK